MKHGRMQGRFALIEMLYEGANATFVFKDIFTLTRFFTQADTHARVEERQLAQTFGEDVVMKLDMAKHGFARAECNFRTAARGVTHDFNRPHGHTITILLTVMLTFAVNVQAQGFGQGIHDRDPYAVQTTRDLVRVVIKLTPRVQGGHDHFRRRHTGLFMDIHGDATAVIFNRDALIRVNNDFDRGAMPR